MEKRTETQSKERGGQAICFSWANTTCVRSKNHPEPYAMRHKID